MQLFYPLSTYWKKKFGIRVWKIPLDAGFNCPNRDGTISRAGCIFCNELGSGTGLNSRLISIKDQYGLFRERLIRRHGPIKFAAYLQSYSNTYCTPSRLQSVLASLAGLEDLLVLCVGTRPDCLDAVKAEILASFPCAEIWLDLGLQSSSEKTLKTINRGHTARDFSWACSLAASKKINVCAHVIAGLPGENMDHFLNTISYLNNEPIKGIKIHNLYVCRNTPLARMWEQSQYHPQELEQYAWWTAMGLALLRPDIIVHRLTGDPLPGELLAPAWAARKNFILNRINEIMTRENLWQGKNCNNT